MECFFPSHVQINARGQKNNADNDLLTRTWVIKTRRMKGIALIVARWRTKKIQDWRRLFAAISKLPLWRSITHPTRILTHHLDFRVPTLMALFPIPQNWFIWIYLLLPSPLEKRLSPFFSKLGIHRILIHVCQMVWFICPFELYWFLKVQEEELVDNVCTLTARFKAVSANRAFEVLCNGMLCCSH